MYFPDKNLADKIVKKYGTPVFVTSKQYIHDNVAKFKNTGLENLKLFYALKANYNPSILKELKVAGIDGVDTVSPFEILMAEKCGFNSNQIIFTGNNSDDDEFKEVYKHGIIPNLGSVSELERFGKLFPGADVSIRFNPGIGAGETRHVITGGSKSKFGVSKKDLKCVKEIVSEYSLNVIGVHCHIGSGFYKASTFKKAVRNIFDIASNFKLLKFVDLGGGFGVQYHPKSGAVRVGEFFSAIKKYVDDFVKENGCNIDIIVEPGKALVAESTCMLTKVTNIKSNGSSVFVGTDTGMNHIIRPAMYSAYQHVVNISNPDAPHKKINVVGNICESSDVICENIKMPMPEEGDILAVLTVGAYCSSMSSLYNLRPYAPEVLVDGGRVLQIRKRLDFKESVAGLGFCG